MLSNFDLISLCKHYKVPLRGVYLRDQLPKKPQPGFYVINLDNSSMTDGTEFGTHWVACVCNQMEAVYFDSFGCCACPEVNRWIKSVYKNYGYNSWICQDIRAETCGFWALCMGIHCFHHHIPMQTLAQCADSFINQFGESGAKNEKLLRAYIQNQGALSPIAKSKL